MQPWSAGAAAVLVTVTVACTSHHQTANVERISPFDRAPLYGMVYDHDNRPCTGASVVLDGVRRAAADRDGRFVVSGLEPGRHTVVLQKEGYEGLTVVVDFDDPGQVLYARMISLEQLLANAEAAIAAAEWGRASSILRRARALAPSDPSADFLRAVLAYKRGDFVRAEERLQRLTAAQDPPPAVLYLFLAELYEHHLGRPALAADALERYLRDSGDPASRDRLERLRSSSQGAASTSGGHRSGDGQSPRAPQKKMAPKGD